MKISITSLIFLTSLFLFSQQNPDGLSADFHKERRSLLRSKMPKNSVALFFANPIRNRSNDVNYQYHQDPNLYYLTGCKEPHSVLVIFSELQKNTKGDTFNEILYVKDKDAKYELWNGKLLGVEKAEKVLQIPTKSSLSFIKQPINFKNFSNVYVTHVPNDVRNKKKNPTDLFDLIATFKKEASYTEVVLTKAQKQLYHAIKSTPLTSKSKVLNLINKAILYHPNLEKDSIVNAYKNTNQNKQFAKILKRITKKLNTITNIDISFLNEQLAVMREIKTKEELVLLKKAVRISAIGQVEMMKAMKAHISEREIQGVHEFVYKKYGAEFEGYPSIVGAGGNGCVLHYVENSKPHVEDGELVLMDLGAQYRGYTADVTRTIPVNGKFSKEQKQIYNIVLAAQKEGIKAAKVGNKFFEPHLKATEIINKGLMRLGIINSLTTKHPYYPHGTSHYLGLDVHDLGTGGLLQENSVITVEPGIYIPKGSKCNKKWWGIAIRIEDDILITKNGPVNLSKDAPRTIEDIERTMSQKSILNEFVLPSLD